MATTFVQGRSPAAKKKLTAKQRAAKGRKAKADETKYQAEFKKGTSGEVGYDSNAYKFLDRQRKAKQAAAKTRRNKKAEAPKKKPLMLGGEEVTQEEMDYFHRQVDIQRQNSILNGNKGYPGYPGMADATKNRDDEKEKNMKTDPKKSYGMADGGRLIVPPVSKGSVTNPSENEGMIENYFEDGPYGTPDRKKKGAAKHENKKARPKKKSKKKSKKSRALGGMRY